MSLQSQPERSNARKQNDSRLFLQKYRPKQIEDFKACYATTPTTDEFRMNNFRVYDILQTLMRGDQMVVLVIGHESTGKTTLMQSLISEYLDNLHYSRENLMVLNTLKDQGIHFYRNDVKNFCQTASRLQRKVVFFDDMDLLSDQSQQVFRFCVDRYHPHCHFIITCTNVHQLIDNLQSRFLVLKLQPLRHLQLEWMMTQIVETEQIMMTDTARMKILELSCQNVCNVKILLSFLEKCKLVRPISDGESEGEDRDSWVMDVDTVDHLCSIISFHHYDAYLSELRQGNMQEAMEIIMNLYDRGFSVMDVLDNFFSYIKHSSPDPHLSNNDKYHMTTFLCKYISYFHNLHEDEIELVLLTNNLYKYFHPSTTPLPLCV